MLARKTKGLGLDIPQAFFFLLLFSSHFFYRSWLNRPAHCCQGCLWARLTKYLPHKGRSTAGISLCVCSKQCCILAELPNCVGNCCPKGSQGDTSLCWACMLRRQVGAPPMATLCFGTRSYLEIPVLHRGGKRQERAEMV